MKHFSQRGLALPDGWMKSVNSSLAKPSCKPLFRIGRDCLRKRRQKDCFAALVSNALRTGSSHPSPRADGSGSCIHRGQPRQAHARAGFRVGDGAGSGGRCHRNRRKRDGQLPRTTVRSRLRPFGCRTNQRYLRAWRRVRSSQSYACNTGLRERGIPFSRETHNSSTTSAVLTKKRENLPMRLGCMSKPRHSDLTGR